MSVPLQHVGQDVEFDQYQIEAHKTDETKKATVSLYGLSGEVGSIFSLFKKRVRDSLLFPKFQEQLREELGDVLWYISSIASIHKISLSDIAEKNLAKARSIFDEGGPVYFDKEYEAAERLPLTLPPTSIQRDVDSDGWFCPSGRGERRGLAWSWPLSAAPDPVAG